MHYGLTEASRAVFIEFHSEKDKLCTVGQPSPNVELKIVGDNGNQLGVDEIGEIQVKGEMVMRGYWNKQKLTEESLENGWLHTGDLGMVDFDGYVHLLGRENDVINIGGLKVAPGEVEEVLLKYKDILEVAVQGVASKDTISDVAIKAFIVCDGMVPSLDEIKKFCLQNLEPYKIPVQFELVNSLPKSSSGKIQKHLLIKENDG